MAKHKFTVEVTTYDDENSMDVEATLDGRKLRLIGAMRLTLDIAMRLQITLVQPDASGVELSEKFRDGLLEQARLASSIKFIRYVVAEPGKLDETANKLLRLA